MNHTLRRGYVFIQKHLLSGLVVIKCKPFAHHLGFVLSQIMGMINKGGRSIVSDVLLDPSIYPSEESTLPDPISHLYGYSASHKWLLSTIMLFVFRPLQVDVKNMAS